VTEPTGPAPDPTVGELAEAVRDLRETVASLRDDVRRASALPPDPEPLVADAHTWLSVLEAPRARRPAVPRIVLEVLFLAACATAAAIADLDALSIIAVLLGAWAVVSLAEVAATRAERDREELLFRTPPIALGADPQARSDDPAWYSPPSEQTMLDVAGVDPTAVTRLPPRVTDLEATQVEHSEVTIEQRPGA